MSVKTIQLGKLYGPRLTTREIGKKAYQDQQPKIAELIKAGSLIDFDVSDITLTNPSFWDEFLVPISREFPNKIAISGREKNGINTIIDFLSQTRKVQLPSIKTLKISNK